MHEMVSGIISRHLRVPASRIVPKARLYADLRMDSLDVFALMTDLETTLDIALPDTRCWGRLKTVDDIFDLIVEAMQGGVICKV